jgi:mRNA-degrading endonuclease toxin of MazEF toxin-antitoxin module
MKPWEVWQWEFPHGSHPAVIISPEARCNNPDIGTVNVAGCSTQRARREPEIHEVLLDRADGLDWETLCRCDVLFLANKSELTRRRGAVAHERRRQLGQKIIRLVGLWTG